MKDVSLDEAKSFLRVDFDDEDELIQSSLFTAKKLILDLIRRPIEDLSDDEGEIFRYAVLYIVGYLYDHRDDSSYTSLVKNLRSILFGLRKEEF